MHPKSQTLLEIHIFYGKNKKKKQSVSFVDFVVKNTYKQEWDRAYLYNENFKEMVEILKNQSEMISKDWFTDDERKLIFIA